MKLNERCSGPRFDPGQVHHKEYCTGFCGWRHPTQFSSILYNGPEYGFDRAISKDMDNTVGDDRKSSKSSKCKRIYIQVLAKPS